MSDEAVKKLTVAAAALAYAVPERSLFRAVEKGQIPHTKRDGVAVVDPADVQAWAARRAAAKEATATASPPAAAAQDTATAAVMPGSLSSAHGGVTVGSGRGTTPSVLDGDLASTLFAAFDQEQTPIEIVQRHRLPPQLVLAAHDQYLQMKSAAAPTQAHARADQLQVALELTIADVEALRGAVDRQSQGLAALENRIAAMPVPPRHAFRCQHCGASAWVASQLECTACGKNGIWGFFPNES